MKYSYRKYQTGDEVAINELYYTVTGRQRTVEQHAWQWLQTPAGESEMWLIEAELDNGQKKLIGHHGVMALDFSYYGEPVRVGKTENTMVLPEYRDKILYPRYEKKFLKQYENKFHALFSTTGPDSAIRLRKAMGYKLEQQWTKVFIGKEPLISFVTLNDVITRKLFNKQYGLIVPTIPESSEINGTKVQAYSDDTKADFDFDGFWEEISSSYPLTPTRNNKSLSWRYWNNPYRQHITLILDSETIGVAVCVLSFRKKFGAFIDDIYCEDITNIPAFLEIIYQWAKQSMLIFSIESHTTTDSIRYFLTKNYIKETSWVEQLNRRIRGTSNRMMPRKITPRGKGKLITTADEWFVTPYYFEGR